MKTSPEFTVSPELHKHLLIQRQSNEVQGLGNSGGVVGVGHCGGATRWGVVGLSGCSVVLSSGGSNFDVELRAIGRY